MLLALLSALASSSVPTWSSEGGLYLAILRQRAAKTSVDKATLTSWSVQLRALIPRATWLQPPAAYNRDADASLLLAFEMAVTRLVHLVGTWLLAKNALVKPFSGFSSRGRALIEPIGGRTAQFDACIDPAVGLFLK